ncbi:MAG: PHP domain-containing protein [Halieaceae bacterium]|nr:PHP domain-containing protein [Halieaceae bacterium]MBT7341007.1 PHP domain-containing protein [Halieaceae bacterium]
MQSLKPLLIDFHTHTTASDGALSPSQLLLRAAERGVQALALTDHDTLSGWQAAQALQADGIAIVCGAELSCQWGGATIHVVGLNVNANSEALVGMLEHLQQLRHDRAAKIGAKLEQLGAPGALAGAQALAGEAAICRPHFAHWLVSEGYMPTVSRAFDKWLGNGKPGDIKTLWPSLAETVAVIVAAGGVPVLAHPLKYRFTRTKLRAMCDAFSSTGGAAIEIVNGRQSDSEIVALKRLAKDKDLMVSLGSDFHREWAHGADLGVDTSIAGDVAGVWEMIL